MTTTTAPQHCASDYCTRYRSKADDRICGCCCEACDALRPGERGVCPLVDERQLPLFGERK